MAHEQSIILLTGAPATSAAGCCRCLKQRGLRVRCVCRQPERVRPRVALATEVVEGDVMAPESLAAAMQGVHTAYYLVHSLGTKQDFEQDDRQAAANFA